MNKRNMEQLRASIANDLVRGQGDYSPTKELLKQYAPLNGVLTSPSPAILPRIEGILPVEKSVAPHATLAQNESLPGHNATVAQDATPASDATVERYAMVKGELRVPNTINFSIFPTLDPFAKAVYYQLFLLSYGFKRDTCIVGLLKLSKSVLMSLRKVQETITYLEKRGLIKRVRSILGGPLKGNVYQVMIPTVETAPDTTKAESATAAGDASLALHATLAPETTVARDATNKYDDDNKKIKSSSKGQSNMGAGVSVENHSGAAVPRERKENTNRDLAIVRAAYCRITGNHWNKSDSEAYFKNGIEKVTVEKIIFAMEAVARRTPVKINSFKYFVKEIVLISDPRNRVWQKKKLEKIVHRIRDSAVGRGKYSMADFVEDVKCACVRENITFDNNIFNELVS